MKNWPSISVIIPSFNQGKYIERTLLSILKQNYPGKVEVIVSDGGSTDETVSVLEKYQDKITWWSEKDEGFVDAVTKGISVASGEILAIQSSDDYYLKNAFRKAILGFSKFPNASFISGGDLRIDLNNKIQNYTLGKGKITPSSILFNLVPQQHATFVRHDYISNVSGLRAEVDMCADMDLWYRIAHLCPGHFIGNYLAVYQLHPEQRTQTSDKWFKSLVRMVESCETNPKYKDKFFLNPDERRDLYTWWQIHWTGKVDPSAAKEIALTHINNLEDYSQRTKNAILKSADNYQNTLTERLKKSLLDGSFAPKTFRGILGKIQKPTFVDLNWWKY